MEISSDPSDPNCEMVMKTIHTELFRCLTCRKAFRSEEGVKRHLEKLHAISDLSENYYEAFVGVKRVKVPKEPAKEKEIADPSVDSTSIAGISFKCSNIYQTFEGVKGHLICFHDVTRPVSSDLFKYILSSSSKTSIKTSTKPSTRFVTPTLENKLAGIIKNNKEEQSCTLSLTEKQDDINKKQSVKRKNIEERSKGSKKPRIDFCKSLANVFNSGNIKVRSLDMWSNDKKKECETPYSNGTQELGYQSKFCVSQSIREPDKSQGDKYCCKKTELQITTTNTESQNTIAQSQTSLANLQTKQSHSKQKFQRKKKLCDDSECRLKGPCSEADCGVCRFCLNRKLK